MKNNTYSDSNPTMSSLMPTTAYLPSQTSPSRLRGARFAQSAFRSSSRPKPEICT